MTLDGVSPYTDDEESLMIQDGEDEYPEELGHRRPPLRIRFVRTPRDAGRARRA